MKNIKIQMTKAEKKMIILMFVAMFAVLALTPISGIALIFLPLIPQLFVPAVKAAAKKTDE